MPGSKSFYQLGIELEEKVKDYFLSQGFRFYAQRFETPFAEVDLVFIKSKRVYFVEVKSYSKQTDFATRVKPAQVQRLERALGWWSDKIFHEPCLLFAFVHSTTGKIQVLNPYA